MFIWLDGCLSRLPLTRIIGLDVGLLLCGEQSFENGFLPWLNIARTGWALFLVNFCVACFWGYFQQFYFWFGVSFFSAGRILFDRLGGLANFAWGMVLAGLLFTELCRIHIKLHRLLLYFRWRPDFAILMELGLVDLAFRFRFLWVGQPNGVELIFIRIEDRIELVSIWSRSCTIKIINFQNLIHVTFTLQVSLILIFE